MPDSKGHVILASSGYAAEVASICHAQGHQVSMVAGTGTALAAAETLGLAAVAWDGDVDAIPPGAVVISFGDSDRRRRLRRELAQRDRTVATLVHPDTTLGLAVEIGVGCIISPGVRITANVHVGDGTLVHTGAILSHDDRIGADVTLSPGVTLCGGVSIEDRAWIAAGATILPNLTIGADAVVGAGALVTQDVPAGVTVVGVPARPR